MVERLAALTTAAREYDLIGLDEALKVLLVFCNRRKKKFIKRISRASHKIQKRPFEFLKKKNIQK